MTTRPLALPLRRWTFVTALAIVVALIWPACLFAHAEPCSPLASGSVGNEWFGFSLDAGEGRGEERRLAIGAPGAPGSGLLGAASVYRLDGRVWIQEVRLPTVERGDRFGTAVALQGNRLAVGAPAATGEQPNAGAVYLFSRGSGTWLPDTPPRVTAADGRGGDQFGAAVALGVTGSVETLVVGAPGHDGGAGSLSGLVYVYRRSGNQWGPPQKLQASNPQPAAEFGAAVAIEGDRLVVGAPFTDESSRRNFGAAYVFQWNGESWTFHSKLPLDFEEDDLQFGASVAIADGRAVVGAPGKDDPGAANRGAAYVFTPQGSGWVRSDLLPADRQARDLFGSSVAIAGNLTVVGAPSHSVGGARSGAAFPFSAGAEQQPVTGSAPGRDDRFGGSVALSDHLVLVGGPLDDPSGVIDAGSVAFCRVGPPECLSIVKTGPEGPVTRGQEIPYTVVVSNGCPDTVFDARVQDSFGANFGPVEWCRQATCNERCPQAITVTGNIDETFDLPKNGEVTYCIEATVGDSATGVLINKACVSAPGFGEVCDDVPNLIELPPQRNMDLGVEITGPAAAFTGDVLRYRITVDSHGTAPATGVRLSLSVPADLIPDAPFDSRCDPASGDCALGTLSPGESTLVELSYKVPPCSACPRTFPATASVRADQPDVHSADDTASLFTEVPCRDADLEIAKSVDPPGLVSEGTLLTYGLTVKNHGPGWACSVIVSDPIPAGLVLESAPGCTIVSGVLECRIDEIEPKGERSFTARFEIEEAECPGEIKNVATVSAATRDTISGNNRDEVRNPVGCGDLCIAKTDGRATVMPGEALIYVITVQNRGNIDAAATVTDIFPAALTNVRWCRDEGFPCTPNRPGDLHDTVLIPAAGSATYRVSGVAVAVCTDTLINTVSVMGPPGFIDVDPSNDSATDETLIEGTGILALCTDISGSNVEGGAITYTFELLNCGPAVQLDNPGDEFTDPLPAGLTFVSIAASSGIPGPGPIWNGSIPVGGTVTITIDTTINAGTVGTTICNQATVNFDGDGNGTNESSAPSDACCFPVLSEIVIPALSLPGLLALAFMLVLLALLRLRRARG